MSGDANEWLGTCPICGKELVRREGPKGCPVGHELAGAGDHARHLQTIADNTRGILLALTEVTSILVDVRKICRALLRGDDE